jgi:tryptophan-rich sensory protein
MVTRVIIYSLAICALGGALEGLFAGSGIKQRLANLRSPSYAVPFWGWMVIGGLYYVICFSVLYRLFLLSPSPARTVALALLGAIMFINALWNYFFFRTGNLFHAYLLGLP